MRAMIKSDEKRIYKARVPNKTPLEVTTIQEECQIG
jgi:hypothetical protein